MPRAKKSEAPPHRLAGVAIGEIECACCGSSVDVKINRNGCAYSWCMAVSEETGNKCMKRENWGLDASRKMIAEFEGKGEDDQPDSEGSEEASGEDQGEVESEADASTETSDSGSGSGDAEPDADDDRDEIAGFGFLS